MRNKHQGKANENATDFSPRILEIVDNPPLPLPGVMLRILALFLFGLITWATIGELDIVARAEGKLIPQTRLKVVQPFEGGRIEKILIHEGQLVKKGQSLLIMDTHLSYSDTEKIQIAMQRVRLQLRRIDAELGTQSLQLRDSDKQEQFEAVYAQFQSHQQAYQSALSEQQAVLDQAQREFDAESVVLKKLKTVLPIQQETEETYRKLGEQGYAAKHLVLEKQQLRIEAEENLRAQGFLVQSLKAKIRESDEKIRSIQSSYQQQLYDEKAVLRQELSQLEQDYKKQQYRNTLMELKAPQDGYVMELATHTEGTVIPSGSVVMRLVPLDEPLKAEVYLNNRDVGFVESGQTARIKLSSYQFQKYGMIDSKVERVSADAIEYSQGSSYSQSDEPQQSRSLSYKTLIVLDKQQLERDGQTFKLRSGMHVTAEIKLGKRTVLEYLLSPIQKTLAEAGTER